MKWSNEMSVKTYPFDIADHLKTDEDIRGFLQEIIRTGDTRDFISALNTAARAKGMTKVAKEMGVSRTSLYKSLAEDSNPGYETITKVVKALGCELEIA
jgi:probable addiction module antidote protein